MSKPSDLSVHRELTENEKLALALFTDELLKMGNTESNVSHVFSAEDFSKALQHTYEGLEKKLKQR